MSGKYENRLANANGYITAPTDGMTLSEVLANRDIIEGFLETSMAHFSNTQDLTSSMIVLDGQFAGAYNPALDLQINLQNSYALSYFAEFANDNWPQEQHHHLMIEMLSQYQYQGRYYDFYDILEGYLTNDLTEFAEAQEVTAACAMAIYPFSPLLYDQMDMLQDYMYAPVYVLPLEPIPIGQNGLHMMIWMGGSAFYDTLIGGIIEVPMDTE